MVKPMLYPSRASQTKQPPRKERRKEGRKGGRRKNLFFFFFCRLLRKCWGVDLLLVVVHFFSLKDVRHHSFFIFAFFVCLFRFYCSLLKKRDAAFGNSNGTAFSVCRPLSSSIERRQKQMLKGGVIMDVVNVEQARIAEEAGAVAVMALERVPADIRKDGGVARMSDPTMIKMIKEAVTIPVMAKARIGHFVEGQVLESIGIDYIDESEVLTPADEINHINKHKFKVPVLCGCRDLGEALRRIAEGCSMIRTKGEAGTGNVVEAVRHCRAVMGDIRRLQAMDEDEVFVYAKEIRAPYELVAQTKKLGRLPTVNFAAGGVATPADAALMMQLGMDGVFVGSGIFKSGDPAKRARAIVQAVTHYNDPKIIAEVSCGLGEAMVGIDCKEMHFTSYAARSE